jgi:hypothetical protein
MKTDLITVSQAMRLAEAWGYPMSRSTVIDWVNKYGLGKKIIKGETNAYYLYRDRFVTAVRGLRVMDEESLELLERWRSENEENKKSS